MTGDDERDDEVAAPEVTLVDGDDALDGDADLDLDASSEDVGDGEVIETETTALAVPSRSALP
ncbi:MAG: hypothetical protein VYE15_08365, partial [Myxococcota bacterium]|nr:hypothetical protein [Myxococcota bacterium]